MTSALVYHTIHFARRLLRNTRAPDEQAVKLLLWRALTECVALYKDPTTFIPPLGESDSQTLAPLQRLEGAKIADLLNEARDLDGAFVNQWLELHRGESGFQRAINLLARDWGNLSDELSTSRNMALYRAQASLGAASQANQLASAASALKHFGESTATILGKTGMPLFQILLAETGGTPEADVRSLLEILVGEQREEL